jgi:hypothetical protein
MMSSARQNAASDSFNEIATVRIEVRHTDPLIWRQVEVPTSSTLKVLHDIIQVVMGWFDYHLWEFTIGKQRFGPPMDDDLGAEPRIEAGKVRLRDVLKPRKTVIDYTYDFGDGWEHRLTVTDVRVGQPGVSYPRYIGDGPRLARENVACRTEVACSHVSGLFTQSGWIAGPDGVREPRPHHSSGIDARRIGRLLSVASDRPTVPSRVITLSQAPAPAETD